MIVYHGSSRIIKQPQYAKGNPHNDFGQGFYCTESLQTAKEWACQNTESGYANKYEFNTESLLILNLNDEKYSVLHWLTLLVQHRIFIPKISFCRQYKAFLNSNFMLPYSEYDAICAFRADVSFFSFAADFLNNSIPLQIFAKTIRSPENETQIVLKSAKSFEHIHFIESEKSPAEEFFRKYTNRDIEERKKYAQTVKDFSVQDAVYLCDIVRKPELLNEMRI